ncbi:MAG: hypothetical protein HOV68_32505, partial [Streptomycetaceae bacterium]|nr:hypothetical protein [Streptomycetaceae bacterium]
GNTGGSAEDSDKSAAEPAPAAAPTNAPQGGDASAAPGYSGTNVHEQGVDEPDLVKTDGRRVLTVADGTLRVVDVATQRQTGELALSGSATDILFSGDRALVIQPGEMYAYDTAPGSGPAKPGASGSSSGQAKLTLVDLSRPTPAVLGELAVDGGYVDARQIGTTARVVIRSTPDIPEPADGSGSYQTRLTRAINNSTVDDWLPTFTYKSGDTRNSGRLVDCASVVRPDTEPGTPGHTGASTTSVLSFDLQARELGTGRAVTVAADADTVYASAANLYIAAEYQPVRPTTKSKNDSGASPARYQPRTAIYRFDISGTDTPKQVASGDVDGELLNQYSLSEYADNLRVATTSQRSSSSTSSESAVTVLGRKGAELAQIGRAGGLGHGEKIYAVRFTGPVGYVVTFRQTDPLYTLDLKDPTAPKVVGQLKINGYSAYLHPIDGGQLIGVGQDATDTGRRLGTQVSLFDVGNLANPARLANYAVTMGNSEAELDPHAFLYWPATGTLVIPLQSAYGTTRPTVPPTGGSSGGTSGGTTGSAGPDGPSSSGSNPSTVAPYAPPSTQALVLRLQNGSFTEVGRITHPDFGQIRRSLVIGDTLWTVSSEGAMVNDLRTLTQRAWVPFV